MAIDVQNLKPSDLVRMLNSAGLGTVLTDSKLRRHRNEAGFSIGTDKTINLLQYAAWLTLEYFRPAQESQTYDEKRRKAAERSADLVRAAQDIGEIPAVANANRKAASLDSFKSFCETYFADIFYLKWSDDHLRAIEKIERAVRNGGLFALAMPRASGKSSLCQCAVLWASLSGANQFTCLIAASAERARDMLENIKVWLETNPLLHEDFPEVCFPIQKLGRIVHRQKGQTYNGEPTRIEWGADRIIFPTLAGSAASGVIISSSGMRGSEIRGQNFARADGRVARPSLILVDDPQTTESAWSNSQSQRREGILAGDVLGMAGPGQKIAGLMACTVIRPGDMADNILSREKHPEWQGERTKLVYTFPTNTKLWEQYAEIRSESLRNDGNGSEATEFYRNNRDAMDTGSEIAWKERFNSDELSAIQHAMNLKLRDEAAFYAEYQNEPLIETEGEESLTADEIASKTNGYERCVVPLDCQYLTTFIDVQQKALFYLTCAWERNFSGYVIDYGTFPDQQRPYFTLRDLHRTLAGVTKNAGIEASIYSGLETLCEKLLTEVYYREDGTAMRIDKCLIDANWGQSTDVIYQFCRQSKHSNVLLPSHGKYVGASSIPFSDYKRQRGDWVGHHCRIPNTRGKRQVRHVLIDTNYWKSFVQARLAVLMGDGGCLSLFGRDTKTHQLLSEHLSSEYRVKTTAFSRTIDEWKLRASRPDNHWLDCLVGSAVAASVCGAELSTLQTEKKKTRERVSFAELQKQRMVEREQNL